MPVPASWGDSAHLRGLAATHGWLIPETALPEDTQLAEVLATGTALPASCVSTLEPWRAQISTWLDAGISGVRIHQALVERHGYTGSYSSVYRMLAGIGATRLPEVPLRLSFQPAEAAQVDFGAGPAITDVATGEIFKTWFFVNDLVPFAASVRGIRARSNGGHLADLPPSRL